jgi:pilus assembly protein CpaE
MKSLRSAGALKPERDGILAVLQEQTTIDRVQGAIRELQLDDELTVSDTLDAALRRIRSGSAPRILLVDLGESAAPIAEVSAARAVGGPDLKLVVLGTVNDVALFRDLLSAGASDYLVKPPTREALAGVLERQSAAAGTTPDGLGQVIVFMGSRGGVGATTSAVSCAWLLAAEYRERIALVDLDLSFGTVALKLDIDPGSGLCEALEQPSRIDSLFIERAMIKVTDTLRVLAAEASAAQHHAVDAGAIDMLLHELRRKFARVVVDLPRGASPLQRVVLATASHVVLVCIRSLAGLRDTIRLQTLVREQAPQARLWLVEAGVAGEHTAIGKSEFEKGVGKPLDASLSYDPKAVGAAANSGQPLPLAAPRSPTVRDIRRLTALLAGPAQAAPKRRAFALPSLW